MSASVHSENQPDLCLTGWINRHSALRRAAAVCPVDYSKLVETAVREAKDNMELSSVSVQLKLTSGRIVSVSDL